MVTLALVAVFLIGSPQEAVSTISWRDARQYVAYRASGPITVDGRLDDEAWKAIPWTEKFVDIEGQAKPAPRFETRVKMTWDDRYFYIAADLAEPHVWGTLTEHDSVIFHDNDFEVFLDPDGDHHQYYEFEINALNTGWDLRLVKPYRDGGPALNEWEIPGLKTGVHIRGTLNDPGDEDEGWSVEIAMPWNVLAEFSRVASPPRPGDTWRINFSRVEWRHQVVDGKYQKVPGTREDNWVWSPQGVIDMHRPAYWGYVQFRTEPPGQAKFEPDSSAPARDLLVRIYEAQRAFRAMHQRYAQTPEELGIEWTEDDRKYEPRWTMTENGYQALVRVPDDGSVWTIREDSLLLREKLPAP